MKKLVVMSDNHGLDEMINIVRKKEPDADYYIHCGDSEAYNEDLLKGFYCVRGNNDWYLNLPDELIIEVEAFKILITHGTHFGYFNREYAMNDILTRNECQVLLCGHTHMPMFIQDEHFYYINPGSTTLPRGGSERSYAVIFINNDKLTFELKKV